MLGAELVSDRESPVGRGRCAESALPAGPGSPRSDVDRVAAGSRFCAAPAKPLLTTVIGAPRRGDQPSINLGSFWCLRYFRSFRDGRRRRGASTVGENRLGSPGSRQGRLLGRLGRCCRGLPACGWPGNGRLHGGSGGSSSFSGTVVDGAFRTVSLQLSDDAANPADRRTRRHTSEPGSRFPSWHLRSIGLIADCGAAAQTKHSWRGSSLLRRRNDAVG